jgi:2',3'-cyclic-nucleotide 2'-phosphodiesterase (5'-nucleotidase family)
LKTRIAFLSLAAALVLFLAGPALAGEAKSLTILFSGDIQGWSSPIPTCGGRNMGGMARVVTERTRLEAKSGPVLLLDAGGFYPLNVFGPYVAEEVYRVGLKAMQATGFDAANLSAADLVQGYPTLRKSQAELNLPLVTTNVVFAGTKVPLMAPFIVKDVGGVKVGILGLSPETDLPRSPAGGVGDAVAVVSPAEALAYYLPQVKAKSDLVVLLSHCGMVVTNELLTAFPDIDLALVAGKDAGKGSCTTLDSLVEAYRDQSVQQKAFPVVDRLYTLGAVTMQPNVNGSMVATKVEYLPLEMDLPKDEKLMAITGKNVYIEGLDALKARSAEIQTQMQSDVQQMQGMSPEQFLQTLQK